MPVDFLQSLALVLIPALVSTGGTIYLGVRMMKLSAAQGTLHRDVAEGLVKQKELAVSVDGQSEKLLALTRAAGVTEGIAIKAEDIKQIVKATQSTIENGGHPQ